MLPSKSKEISEKGVISEHINTVNNNFNKERKMIDIINVCKNAYCNNILCRNKEKERTKKKLLSLKNRLIDIKKPNRVK